MAPTKTAPRFRELAESLPHMVWTCRGDGPCDYLSPQWITYTGIPEEEQLGYGWLDQLHPDDADATRARWAEAAGSGGAFDTEFRIRRHDGAYRWFKTRAVPVRDEDGQVLRWYGTNTDIQDVRDAHDAAARLNRELEARVARRTEALRAASERLRIATSGAGVGVWDWDVESGALVWDDTMRRLYELSENAPVTFATWRDAILHPEDVVRLEAELTRALASGAAFDVTFRIRCPSGVKHLRAVATFERDGRGVVVRGIGVNWDVTRERVAEAEMVQLNRLLAERTRQMEVLIQEVHHRVKNNLQVIASLINLQLRTVPDAAACKALSDCRTRILAIALIHDQLHRAPDFASLEFADYVRKLVGNIFAASGARGDQVQLALDLEPVTLPLAIAIPCGLVLNELVTNALKHAFPGDRRGTVRVGLAPGPGSVVTLSVHDDGVGLGELEPSRRPSLGMELVHELAHQVHGRLEITSDVSDDHGTRVTLVVPPRLGGEAA